VLYRTNADLPQGVRTSLPDVAQNIFRKAANSLDARNPDLSESRLFYQAWAAVTKAGWSPGDDGKWVHEVELEDDDEPRPRRRRREQPEAFDESPGQLWAFERISFDRAADPKPEKTADGYLVAFPRVARSGIQIYSGPEVGRPDLKDVRVYRPAEEVFHRDSLHSYAHKPVTNDHPPELVTSRNWSKYGVGDIGEEVLRDGEFVRVPLKLMDQQAIDDYEAGKAELSLGYTMNLKWGAGTTPTGEEYDAAQSHIRANHLALCDSARGGPMLRIGDSYPGRGEPAMTTKQIVVDGLTVSLEPRDAEIVQRAIDKLSADQKAFQKQLDDLNAALKLRDEQISAAKKDGETKDGKIAALEKQLKDGEVTPAKLQELVAARTAVVEKARALIGDRLVIDGRSEDDIRRQVVDAHMGGNTAAWTTDKVNGAFELLAVRGVGAGGGNNQLDNVLRDGIQMPVNAREARDKAYLDMLQRDQEAWRNKPPTAAHN
jgi:cation transport regulator ChaB